MIWLLSSFTCSIIVTIVNAYHRLQTLHSTVIKGRCNEISNHEKFCLF